MQVIGGRVGLAIKSLNYTALYYKLLLIYYVYN